MRLWILAAALACSTAAQAATVVKCTDATGKVTFAQNVCPGDTQGGEVEVKAAARPSGEGPAVQLADPSKTYAAPKPKTDQRERRDVGASEEASENAEQPAAVTHRAPPVVRQQVCYKNVLVKNGGVDKNGKRYGQAEYVKVPVPCNTR